MKNKNNIFRGRLLNLSTKNVCLPNGNNIRLEIIDHPGAALIVPFLNSGEVIILKQFRPVVNKYLYELPAGTLGKNESVLSCARRELVEETGYCAKRIEKIGVIYPVPGYSTEKIVIFKAGGLAKVKAKKEMDEVIEASIMPRKTLQGLFKKGQIVDAKTICALTLCGWL